MKEKKTPERWNVVRRDIFRRDIREIVAYFPDEYHARRHQYHLTVEKGGGGAYYEVEKS